MKRFLLLFSLLFLSITLTGLFAQKLVSTNPQPRNVVLEEFTGIYCGFCPEGHEIAEKIRTDNPGRVVLINVHSGSYSVPQAGSGHPDFQTPWGAALVTMSNLVGFPAGQVNRQIFKGSAYAQQDTAKNSLALSRSGWVAAGNVILTDANSPVNIGAAVQRVGKDSLYITVELYYTADVTQNNKLNVVLLESGYIGYQGGSKGSDTYVHNHIMRDMVTGQWGEVITTTTKGTLIEKVYKYKITDRVNPLGSKMQLAVFVTQNDNKNIYTGIEINVPEIQPNAKLTSIEPSLVVKPTGVPYNKTYELENLTDNEIEFDILLEKTTRTPTDWNVAITEPAGNTIKIPAKGKINVTLSITPGATLGFGDATVKLQEKNTEMLLAYSSQTTCISQEIQNFQVITDTETKRTLSAMLTNKGWNNVFEIPASQFLLVMNDFPDLKTLIWNAGVDGSFGTAGTNAIMAFTDKGVNQFLCGSQAISGMGTTALTKYKIQYSGYSTQGYGASPWQVWFGGVNGDPVGNFLGASVEGNLINWLISLYKITDPANTMPFIHFKNTGKYIVTNGSKRDTLWIGGEDAAFGFRNVDGITRTALLSISPYIIKNDAIRTELVNRIMVWLNGTGPIAETDKSSFSFLVRPGNSLEIPFNIINSGDKLLQVSDMKLEGKDPTAFTLVDEAGKAIEFPVKIGKSSGFKLIFAPTEENFFSATLKIKSNSVLDSVIILNISANSSTVDVPEYKNNETSLSVFPNPVSGEASVHYSIGNGLTGIADLALYNLSGIKVKQLSEKFETAGSYNLMLSTEGIESGYYLLVLKFNGSSIFAPVIIAK
jgi:hypothetical protein